MTRQAQLFVALLLLVFVCSLWLDFAARAAVVDNAGGITISHTTGDMDMATHPIHSAGNPASAQDVTTKAYEDSRVFFAGSWCASSANATASTRFLNYNLCNAAPQSTLGPGPDMNAMPFAGSVSALACRHTNAVLTTDTVTYTVQIESVDSAITCTVAANTTTCTDAAHTVTFSAGDRISIKTVQSSTQPSASMNPVCTIGVKTAATG